MLTGLVKSKMVLLDSASGLAASGRALAPIEHNLIDRCSAAGGGRMLLVGVAFAHGPESKGRQKAGEILEIASSHAFIVTPTTIGPWGLLWRRSPRSVEALWKLSGRFGPLVGVPAHKT